MLPFGRTTHLVALVLGLVAGAAVGCASESKDPHPAPRATGGTFVEIFNGKDLTGWTYGTKNDGGINKAGEGYRVENGVLYSTPDDGGALFTEREYADFVLDF